MQTNHYLQGGSEKVITSLTQRYMQIHFYLFPPLTLPFRDTLFSLPILCYYLPFDAWPLLDANHSGQMQLVWIKLKYNWGASTLVSTNLKFPQNIPSLTLFVCPSKPICKDVLAARNLFKWRIMPNSLTSHTDCKVGPEFGASLSQWNVIIWTRA